MVSILFLQPPSPPGMEVNRDYAGGFGTAISVRRGDFGHGAYSVPNAPLMYSAGMLKRNEYDVGYVDAQAERLNAESTLLRIRRLEPQVVVAVVNLPSIEGDRRFLAGLRERLGVKLVCIGTVCRVLPETLARLDIADILVLGEPESVLPRLFREIHEGDVENVDGIAFVENGNLHGTKPSEELVDLKSLPWPPHEMMPITRYRDYYFGPRTRFFPLWASRGCPMPCSFYCPYPLSMGKRIRLRSTEDVVREVRHLHQQFGISAFLFRDQMFSFDMERAEELCDMLIAQEFGIRWLCETRFDRVSAELLRKMRKAGCEKINFGLETGDPELLREVGKPGMKLSTVKAAIEMTKRTGIEPYTHLILGLPGETNRSVRETLKTLRELGITQLNVNFSTPYPGTALFQYAKQKGLLETEDWSRYTSFNPVMRTESMSIEELKKAKSWFGEDIPKTLLTELQHTLKGKGVLGAIQDAVRFLIEKS